jgi:hypothetical protein
LYLVGHQNDAPSNDSDTFTEEYSLEGYAVIICLSAFYFSVSAILLRYVNDESDA